MARQRLRPERVDLEPRRDARRAEFGCGSGAVAGAAAVDVAFTPGGVALLQAASSTPVSDDENSGLDESWFPPGACRAEQGLFLPPIIAEIGATYRAAGV